MYFYMNLEFDINKYLFLCLLFNGINDLRHIVCALLIILCLTYSMRTCFVSRVNGYADLETTVA